jgi:hypothetical protein
MAAIVTLTGFVGLHPHVAFTRKGVKVLVFSVGLRLGHRAFFREVAVNGDLADRHGNELVPGCTVTVAGELKAHAFNHHPYLLASEIQVHTAPPQLSLDFAA